MKVFHSRKLLGIGVLLFATTLIVHGASPKDTAVVKDVVFNSNGQSLEVQITASEQSKFTYFELNNPHRLVVDFHETQSTIGFKEKQVEFAGVERVRTGPYRNKDRKATRIVFDLNATAPYRVVDDGAGQVRVLFAPQEQTVEVGSAPPAPAPAEKEVQQREAEPVRAAVNLKVGSVPAPALRPVALAPESKPVTSPVLNLPTIVTVPPVEPEVVPPALAAAPPPAPPAPPPVAPVAAAPAPAPANVPRQITVAPPVTPGQSITAPPQQQQYSGEITSWDLKDVDIKDFFRSIGEISGLNIVLDPNVSGAVTVLLKDVPWDQALDVVLRNNGLGGQLQGNVLRIATNATLAAEEAARQAQRDAQDKAVDLVTRTYILNYTKADAVSQTLQKLLTSRGTIIQDTRRNALIVSDIPGQFGRVDQLVQFLDTPAQQVEIEARLLSATKSFSRELGNQLGLLIGNRGGNILTGATGASSPFSRTPAPRATTGGTALPLLANFPAAATTGIAFLMQPGGDILLDEIISASEQRGTAKLISRPKITTQNNQAASVSVGSPGTELEFAL